ncbi:MAG: 1,4-dihydroxy-2-naphthoate polyprenyltransferase [Gemmatimonadota bacterium]|nr:1,4-dihydroxy-2-naphthoate polyprenyltransferase [Gemmatimonadota bacterium]MDH5198582.1 1,4-dihydroxy-2-naphthoate polyprenyltransferase [Gemmatimonadota bacterium]
MTTSRAGAVLLAARPKTLTAALVPVMVGTALAHALGFAVRWDLAGFALLGAGAIQIGTNLYNDLLDHERGADTGARVGPVRVTQAGLLAPWQVRLAAAASFLVAIACGIPLVLAGGWPILVLGLLSLVFGYAYTGGPFPLAYHGLGEVFVLLFFGFGAVGGTYWLHAGRLVPQVALAAVQVGFLACALLAVNNLRDVDEDSRSRKHTLAVLLGPRFGRGEIVAFACGPLVFGLLWVTLDQPLAATLPFGALPLAMGVLHIVLREPPSPRYNIALARAAALQLAFGLLLSLGLVL